MSDGFGDGFGLGLGGSADGVTGNLNPNLPHGTSVPYGEPGDPLGILANAVALQGGPPPQMGIFAVEHGAGTYGDEIQQPGDHGYAGTEASGDMENGLDFGGHGGEIAEEIDSDEGLPLVPRKRRRPRRPRGRGRGRGATRWSTPDESEAGDDDDAVTNEDPVVAPTKNGENQTQDNSDTDGSDNDENRDEHTASKHRRVSSRVASRPSLPPAFDSNLPTNGSTDPASLRGRGGRGRGRSGRPRGRPRGTGRGGRGRKSSVASGEGPDMDGEGADYMYPGDEVFAGSGLVVVKSEPTDSSYNYESQLVQSPPSAQFNWTNGISTFAQYPNFMSTTPSGAGNAISISRQPSLSTATSISNNRTASSSFPGSSPGAFNQPPAHQLLASASGFLKSSTSSTSMGLSSSSRYPQPEGITLAGGVGSGPVGSGGVDTPNDVLQSVNLELPSTHQKLLSDLMARATLTQDFQSLWESLSTFISPAQLARLQSVRGGLELSMRSTHAAATDAAKAQAQSRPLPPVRPPMPGLTGGLPGLSNGGIAQVAAALLTQQFRDDQTKPEGIGEVDVLTGTGVDFDAEQAALEKEYRSVLANAKKNFEPTTKADWFVGERGVRREIDVIAKRHSLTPNNIVAPYLVLAMEHRLRSLADRFVRASKHRTGLARVHLVEWCNSQAKSSVPAAQEGWMRTLREERRPDEDVVWSVEVVQTDNPGDEIIRLTTEDRNRELQAAGLMTGTSGSGGGVIGGAAESGELVMDDAGGAAKGISNPGLPPSAASIALGPSGLLSNALAQTAIAGLPNVSIPGGALRKGQGQTALERRLPQHIRDVNTRRAIAAAVGGKSKTYSWMIGGVGPGRPNAGGGVVLGQTGAGTQNTIGTQQGKEQPKLTPVKILLEENPAVPLLKIEHRGESSGVEAGLVDSAPSSINPKSTSTLPNANSKRSGVASDKLTAKTRADMARVTVEDAIFSLESERGWARKANQRVLARWTRGLRPSQSSTISPQLPGGGTGGLYKQGGAGGTQKIGSVYLASVNTPVSFQRMGSGVVSGASGVVSGTGPKLEEGFANLKKAAAGIGRP
ncbi:hypothetical protein HDU93_008067 [Gonapodya sp. JEL0774]|nr:hypothetical protein HDU93_008067 [Gonapodya sp. JEL0774]